jgi:O-methyltransferase involved in polyketide biosynthesis
VSPAAPGSSRTSRSVAVTRATFDRPHTPAGDPLAQMRLCEGMPPHMLASRIPSLRTRTRFFDEAVLHALAHDISQIVILGAGYDDRALRSVPPAHGSSRSTTLRRKSTSAPASRRSARSIS